MKLRKSREIAKKQRKTNQLVPRGKNKIRQKSQNVMLKALFLAYLDNSLLFEIFQKFIFEVIGIFCKKYRKKFRDSENVDQFRNFP